MWPKPRKFTVRVVALIGAAAVLFLVWRGVRLTADDQLLWFVSEPAIVLANRRQTQARVHLEWKRRVSIVTPLNDQSYLVTVPPDDPKGHIEGCNGWRAPRLPIFPFFVFTSDAPPCNGFEGSPHDRALVFADRSLTFISDKGDRLEIKLRRAW